MTTALKQALEALEIGAEWTSEYVSQMKAYTISERAADGLAIIQAAITAAESELSREQPARAGQRFLPRNGPMHTARLSRKSMK